MKHERGSIMYYIQFMSGDNVEFETTRDEEPCPLAVDRLAHAIHLNWADRVRVITVDGELVSERAIGASW
jgi:hypothetical protein